MTQNYKPPAMRCGPRLSTTQSLQLCVTGWLRRPPGPSSTSCMWAQQAKLYWSQSKNDVVEQGDRQGYQHAKNDPAIFCVDQKKSISTLAIDRELCVYRELIITYIVLRMAGWTLYSLANTNGTIPCGRAACQMPGEIFMLCYSITHREIRNCTLVAWI